MDTTGVPSFDRVCGDFEDRTSFYFCTISEKDIGLVDTEPHSLASHSNLSDSIEFDHRIIGSESEDLEGPVSVRTFDKNGHFENHICSCRDSSATEYRSLFENECSSIFPLIFREEEVFLTLSFPDPDLTKSLFSSVEKRSIFEVYFWIITVHIVGV
jgi:hypothetical protein